MIVLQLFIDTWHPIHSADVTADPDSILLATRSQRNMVRQMHREANAKKFADSDVYRRRAELMQLLHPEKGKVRSPHLATLSQAQL